MKSIFTKEYEQLIACLVEARKRAGLTQRDVAEQLGRPQSFVSKYERGERRLDVIEFIHVARAIGIKASALVADLEQDLLDFESG